MKGKYKKIERMGKPELAALINKLSEVARKTGISDKARRRLDATKRKARRVLCECIYCADATIETHIDKHGNEKDKLKKDCGSAECPYMEYFEKSESDEKIRHMLGRLLRAE